MMPTFAPRAFLFTALLGCASSLAAACPDFARTELEKLFCQVQQSAEGKSLPSFEDFRRNSPQVQALLLKRPAERLGLPLPKAAAPGKATAPVARQRPPRGQSSELAAELPPPSPPPRQKEAHVPSVELGITGCRLQGEKINCAKGTFNLVNNKHNRQLAPEALGPENRFGLAPFTGRAGDESALRGYLGQAYRHYIDKMLAIGLGASTMSYTKFYYTYQEVSAKGEDFAARFETMYDYLKKDKVGMAIKARYDNSLPTHIDQCVDLSEQVVVCDSGSRNWVFSRD